MTRGAPLRALGVLAVGLGACSPAQGHALPPPAPDFEVVQREFRFDHQPVVAAGRVVFRVGNAGRLDHELTLVRLPEDFGPIADELASEERRSVATTAYLLPRAPGATGTFAVDLAPGRYALICFIPDAGGVAHYEKGMSSEVRAA